MSSIIAIMFSFFYVIPSTMIYLLTVCGSPKKRGEDPSKSITPVSLKTTAELSKAPGTGGSNPGQATGNTNAGAPDKSQEEGQNGKNEAADAKKDETEKKEKEVTSKKEKEENKNNEKEEKKTDQEKKKKEEPSKPTENQPGPNEKAVLISDPVVTPETDEFPTVEEKDEKKEEKKDGKSEDKTKKEEQGAK